MVTGDAQEEVLIFRDKHTNTHFIIIYISSLSSSSRTPPPEWRTVEGSERARVVPTRPNLGEFQSTTLRAGSEEGAARLWISQVLFKTFLFALNSPSIQNNPYSLSQSCLLWAPLVIFKTIHILCSRQCLQPYQRSVPFVRLISDNLRPQVQK